MTIASVRPLRLLCIQLKFHDDFKDASALASTYNDGIYYVASFLMSQLPNLQVDVCQMFWEEDPEDFPIEEYDYIFVSCLAAMFGANLAALKAIRTRAKPSAKIVFGGPHASFAPHEVLRFGDYAVLGEGEIPALQLVLALEGDGDVSKVDNLCYARADGTLVMNPTKRYGNIDNPINTSLLRSPRRGRIQWAAVSMSRGCPYNCSFCYAIRLLGREFRTKNVSTIRGELQALGAEVDGRRFYVSDINFGTSREFCHQVADTVADLDFRFIAMTRIELADDVALLRHLKSAGFEEYYVGVESEQPEVLKSWNKKCSVSKQAARLHRFAEEDIYIQAGLMFGLDSQDEDTIRNSAIWAAEARITHPIFMCVAEYPFQTTLFGSHQDIEDHRIIVGGPTYQHYSYVGIFPRHMRPSVLQRRIHECYRIFFERAAEIETRPQRRARLKNHARCVGPGVDGMLKHARYLEDVERPYYTAEGTLREDLLRSDFESRYGLLRARLAKTIHVQGELTQLKAQ